MIVFEGQMLLRQNISLPEQVHVRGNSLSEHWLALDESAVETDKKVRSAEWHFFWLTHECQGWSLALDPQQALKAALRKAAEKIDRRYNAGEVVRITKRNFLGLYFCKIELAARHIQQGPILGLTETVGIIAPALVPSEKAEIKRPVQVAA
ncbi:MAG TPA: hypothetical protein VFA02_12090 [Pseudacidobacterium sp.]|nr:hypothetical protein [Pseudacidobacterium sp.]